MSYFRSIPTVVAIGALAFGAVVQGAPLLVPAGDENGPTAEAAEKPTPNPATRAAGMNAALLGDVAAEYDVRPVAATGTHTIAGHEIIMPAGGQTVQLEVFVGMWDDGSDTTQVSAYQTTLHCPDYYSALQGTLTPLDTPTIMWGPEDPYPSFGVGVDKSRDDYIFKYALGDFGGCNLNFLCPDMVTPLAFYCGFATANPQSCIDEGNGVNCIEEYRYVLTASFDVSPDARGTFTVGLSPNPVLTSLKNQFSQSIGPLGIIPALITIETGRCCYQDEPPDWSCINDETQASCDSLPSGQFMPGETCGTCGCPDCVSNADCDDGNECTTDLCTDCGCTTEPSYDPDAFCCDPTDGSLLPLDDNNPCTVDSCNSSTGEVEHTRAQCAVAVGGRYFLAAAPEGQDPVALLVVGDSGDPAVSCVSLYVQGDHTLGATPVFQTPDSWGTMSVRGEEIIPASTYNVYLDDGTTLSDPVELTTFVWGDVDDDGVSDVSDILLTLDAFAGRDIPVRPEAADLMRCLPTSWITIDDILAAVVASQGSIYTDSGCSLPCP